MTEQILTLIKNQFVQLIEYMRETVIFDSFLGLADFPVTIWDLSMGFLCVSVFLWFFGFLVDDDDEIDPHEIYEIDDDYYDDWGDF